jgi:hypothetical protein
LIELSQSARCEAAVRASSRYLNIERAETNFSFAT